jgi:ABC-2 type transport system ATP-binding protein
MLMGVLSPTAGRARVLGTDVFEHPLEVKQRVGYVPESHYVSRWP